MSTNIKGFRQFILKFLCFSAFALTAVYLLAASEFPPSEIWKSMVNYLAYAFEALLLFYLLSRHELKDLHSFVFRKKQFIAFALISLLLLILRSSLEWNFFRKFVTVFALLFLFLAIFGVQFSYYFLNRLRREFILSTFLLVLLNVLINFFYNSWVAFAGLTITIVYNMLKLSFQNVTLDLSNPAQPIIGLAPQFVALVLKECSGIESLILFTFLYFIASALDFKKFHKLHLIYGYLAGIIGIYLVTVLRIYIIILIGYFINKDLAVGLAHTWIGVLLFLIYFFVFWKISYKWLLKK